MMTLEDIKYERNDIDESITHIKQELASAVESIRMITKTAYFGDVRHQKRFIIETQKVREKLAELELTAINLIAVGQIGLNEKLDEEIAKGVKL